MDGWRGGKQQQPSAAGGGDGRWGPQQPSAAGGGDGRWGPQPWVVGTPAPSMAQSASWENHIPSVPSAPANPYSSVAGSGNPYVQVSPIAGSTGSCNPSPNPFHPSASSSSFGTGNGPAQGSGGAGNPYVQVAPLPGPADKGSTDVLFKALGRCGKKLESSTRKAGGVAGNVWNHLKTSPNLTDAALTKLAQGTKVLAEGGNDKVFQQIFGIYPGEQFLKSFACYLSTSSGPVIGTLYLSTRRIAFCSDNPLSPNVTQGQQERIYYKVVLLLDQLKAVNPSTNKANAAEKYIQVVTIDDHEFWFMGFVSYDKATKNLMEALQNSRVAA